MTTKTDVFSLNNLDVFERPGVREIERRDDEGIAGCWVRFTNGWVLSIQWGNGNYSDNHNAPYRGKPEDSTTAEIAAWRDEPDHDMVKWGTDAEWADNVQGYCPMERVQHILDLLAEDKLLQPYQPPTPPVEMRAVDGWKDSE